METSDCSAFWYPAGKRTEFTLVGTHRLASNAAVTVSASPLDDAHPYVGAVTLNGKPLARTFLRHAEIVAGGELHFTMQAQPDKRWGTAVSARPA